MEQNSNEDPNDDRVSTHRYDTGVSLVLWYFVVVEISRKIMGIGRCVDAVDRRQQRPKLQDCKMRFSCKISCPDSGCRVLSRRFRFAFCFDRMHGGPTGGLPIPRPRPTPSLLLGMRASAAIVSVTC